MQLPKELKQYLHNNMLRLTLFWLLITVSIIGLTAEYAYTQTTITNDFDLPMDNPTGTIGYDLKNASLSGPTCFKDDQGNAIDWSNLYHAGEDWFASEGTEVKAVADGKVVFTSDVNYPGNVVIIEHTLSDNSIVYSMYGHLKNDSTVSLNQTMTKGDVIGHLKLQELDDGTDNTHLHWEIRNFEDGGFICDNNYTPGPGYTYPNQPDNFPGRCERFYNPSDYVNTPQTGFCLVYLPIVEKYPTPIPCPHDQQLIVNGGFESGATSWVEDAPYPIIYNGSGAHSGNWHAFMAGYPNADDKIYQNFVLPAGSTGARLDYYFQLGTYDNDPPPHHFLYVRLKTGSGQTIALLDQWDNTADEGTWYHVYINVYNLSSWAGQTLRLSYEADTDGSSLSAFHVDDVNFKVDCSLSSAGVSSSEVIVERSVIIEGPAQPPAPVEKPLVESSSGIVVERTVVVEGTAQPPAPVEKPLIESNSGIVVERTVVVEGTAQSPAPVEKPLIESNSGIVVERTVVVEGTAQPPAPVEKPLEE